MPHISLSFIDWVIIALYFAVILAVGFYLRRFASTGEDFFLAGRRNSSWVAGLAFLSANLGALEILGWTGGTYQYGIYAAHFYWIGAIPAMLFLGLYMMPFYYSGRIHSIPGYLRLRFDEKTRVLNGFSFAIMTLLVSGINLYSMALVLNTFLGWNWDACMWVSAATVACYVTLGGLLSAIFTEIVQFFLIWFGLFLVSILGIIEIGGFDEIFARLPENMGRLWATSSDPARNAMGVTWPGIVLGLGFVLSFGYWTTDFLVVQRAFSSKDLRSARMTPILASFFKMALPFIVVVGALVAWKLANSGDGSFQLLRNEKGDLIFDSALPLLVARYYPEGLIGLGITALLAGFMAGQAGNISAFNTVWTYDIYHSVINRKASDAHLVWMGRVSTLAGIFISVGTAYWAKSFPSIMDYMQAIFSWVNAPLFATMLLAMFSKRITSAGAFYGLIIGMLSSFLLFLGLKFNWFSAYYVTFSEHPGEMSNNLWRAWWAWLATFCCTVLISLFTKPKPDGELVGLVKGLTEIKEEKGRAWRNSLYLWAGISLIVLIVLNIYFWG
ncbi:MAG: sodium:solute symporter family protein, partial [Deltaproteobacteria bacterium]|nr:sodium:solute symporter family protein [Deltaproteobacteria bacterium]